MQPYSRNGIETSSEQKSYTIAESDASQVNLSSLFSKNDEYGKGTVSFSEDSYPIRKASVTRRKYVAK